MQLSFFLVLSNLLHECVKNICIIHSKAVCIVFFCFWLKIFKDWTWTVVPLKVLLQTKNCMKWTKCYNYYLVIVSGEDKFQECDNNSWKVMVSLPRYFWRVCFENEGKWSRTFQCHIGCPSLFCNCHNVIRTWPAQQIISVIWIDHTRSSHFSFNQLW